MYFKVEKIIEKIYLFRILIEIICNLKLITYLNKLSLVQVRKHFVPSTI